MKYKIHQHIPSHQLTSRPSEMGVASAQSCSETPKGKVGILNGNELNHFQFYFYARYGHGLPKVAVLSISNVAVTLRCQSEKVQQITSMAV